MGRSAVFFGTMLLGVFLTENAGVALAQDTGNIEDRIPVIDSQLAKPDDNSDPQETKTPTDASGLINISIPPSEIDKRLPAETPKKQDKADTLALPPPPALRERPTSMFVLTAVEISGVTAFPPETFAPLYDNMLARTVSVKDVARITEAITAAYRAEGYFLSRATAPAQSADSGVLHIEVSEGYLANVSVKGGNAQIRNRLKKLTDARPLKLTTLERTLALVGDLKGVSIKSTQIEPDPIDFARHRLMVEIEHDAFEASLYADNRGTDAAGPIQLYARGAANSLIRTGDQLSLGLFTTPTDPNELSLAELSYHLPLLDSGTYATFSGMLSKFNAGASLATLDTETQTKRLSFSLSHPIIRKRKTSLWANIGIEGRNIEEEQLGLPSFDDKLRTVSAWTNFRSEHWNGYTTVFGKVTRGLDMFGATVDSTSLSRPDANGEFTKFEAQISRYQNIGQVFGVYASVAGQSSLDPLLASEEFSLGGARFGRAYDYGELTGDDGAAAIIELRYGRNPNLAFLDFYQFYGFYDYGVVWNDNAAPGFEELSLSSVGGGLRLTLPLSISVTMEAAKPLDTTPFTLDDDWRGFFSVSKSF
ncbi:ShlB/FhaC/HecB family hemolysin secretion/activation protein [Hyphococcus flavus]|uniref:ShlB/FhaC/HecB family hemolysin secretion/activation protein n=1 Tax=Hyphococcus flavus TaxID=1866326 RepID=A0AAE9ZI38_9PROT|nr:ShlB/FhaC/HecB family hemolysin secretion/activation protein [Hyphococcus flavus]WDI33037.1 ShlB/FhaC/HecB family hemolysin secretion/activation protein [Hyphococcus flavus]